MVVACLRQVLVNADASRDHRSEKYTAVPTHGGTGRVEQSLLSAEIMEHAHQAIGLAKIMCILVFSAPFELHAACLGRMSTCRMDEQAAPSSIVQL